MMTGAWTSMLQFVTPGAQPRWDGRESGDREDRARHRRHVRRIEWIVAKDGAGERGACGNDDGMTHRCAPDELARSGAAPTMPYPYGWKHGARLAGQSYKLGNATVQLRLPIKT